jgi:hypothetical protein
MPAESMRALALDGLFQPVLPNTWGFSATCIAPEGSFFDEFIPFAVIGK